MLPPGNMLRCWGSRVILMDQVWTVPDGISFLSQVYSFPWVSGILLWPCSLFKLRGLEDLRLVYTLDPFTLHSEEFFIMLSLPPHPIRLLRPCPLPLRPLAPILPPRPLPVPAVYVHSVSRCPTTYEMKWQLLSLPLKILTPTTFLALPPTAPLNALLSNWSECCLLSKAWNISSVLLCLYSHLSLILPEILFLSIWTCLWKPLLSERIKTVFTSLAHPLWPFLPLSLRYPNLWELPSVFEVHRFFVAPGPLHMLAGTQAGIPPDLRSKSLVLLQVTNISAWKEPSLTAPSLLQFPSAYHSLQFRYLFIWWWILLCILLNSLQYLLFIPDLEGNDCVCNIHYFIPSAQ